MAKSKLFFETNFENMDGKEFLEYGDEYITKINEKSKELHLNYLGLVISQSDNLNLNDMSYKYKRKTKIVIEMNTDPIFTIFKYQNSNLADNFNFLLAEAIKNEEQTLQDELTHTHKADHSNTQFLLSKIDAQIYLVCSFSTLNPEIMHFFNTIYLQLKYFASKYIKF